VKAACRVCIGNSESKKGIASSVSGERIRMRLYIEAIHELYVSRFRIKNIVGVWNGISLCLMQEIEKCRVLLISVGQGMGRELQR
jgi:hypothetical protein